MKNRASEKQERRRCYFSGRVQGVGFRWHARAVARETGGITGFARNLPDGRVEIVVEGHPEKIDNFLCLLKECPAGRGIIECREETGPAAGNFDSFEIRF